MRRLAGTLTVFLLMAAGAEQPKVMPRLKDLQRSLGFSPTGNFQGPGERRAYYRCYYTGKLELPESYDDLGLKEGTAAGCAVDERKYDVFYYAAEAVASGSSPVTSSLAEAPLERVLVVVPHEDFHESREAQRLPPALAEAAATLAGFLTAAEFARREYGETSESYQRLAREPDLFLGKSEIVNRTHAKLRSIYGKLGREQALVEKVRALLAARRECEAIQPDPTSFHKCLSADNNAGLAFDYTYTRHYPRVYAIYESNGREVRSTLDALRRLQK